MDGDDPVEVTPGLLRDRPLPEVGTSSSKEERGTTLVVAGTAETPGAALLAGEAVLRAGGGRLQVATAASVAVQVGVALPEARVIAVDASDELDEALAHADAVVVGPGTSEPGDLAGVVARAVEALGRRGVLVVDAGALGLLVDEPDLLSPLGARAVVMPNPGELAPMLHRSEVDQADLAQCAIEAAEAFGCVVTVRGADTWTTGPDGVLHVDRSGTPGLGTSGSGDVLAGLIAGLASRGAPAFDAVLWATHVHGWAGRRCEVDHGRVGFLARELLHEVPAAFLQLVG